MGPVGDFLQEIVYLFMYINLGKLKRPNRRLVTLNVGLVSESPCVVRTLRLRGVHNTRNGCRAVRRKGIPPKIPLIQVQELY